MLAPKQPVVRIAIERAKASPEQLAAWRRLWTKLLAAPTGTATVDRPEEGKASARQSNEMQYQENGK
jgi:transposase-like protein